MIKTVAVFVTSLSQCLIILGAIDKHENAKVELKTKKFENIW